MVRTNELANLLLSKYDNIQHVDIVLKYHPCSSQTSFIDTSITNDTKQQQQKQIDSSFVHLF